MPLQSRVRFHPGNNLHEKACDFFAGLIEAGGHEKTCKNETVNIHPAHENEIRSTNIKETYKKNALLLILAAVVLCGLPAVTLAQGCFPQRTWVGSSGSWFEPTNWNDGHIPTSGTSAQINNGGAAAIDSPGAEARDLTLGLNAGDSGTVSLNAGSLTIVNDTQVGAAGTGTLNITNGGTVSAAVAVVAGSSGSIGTVSVDGASLTIRGGACVVGGDSGPGGIGLMTVTNGGTVTAASVHVYKSGTLTGNGTVSMGSGSGTATVEGTVSRSNGTLTITGNLSLTSIAATQFSVTPQDNPNQADISVSGTATLDGRLLVTMTGNFTPGTTYTLLHCEGLRNGTFSSVSINYPCECFKPVIQYDDHNVKLYLGPAACCTQ